ncbi:hypothetical protein E4634_12145 [Mangrovimicrobium sediminis]|uniref:Uncharacterized protein n=1 Tax=Mangrovimicrobium sediminis TaxID=2562682 RepID=A0A4Z0M0L8_9GAMM|nr:hypothetical protein [Haliea sp. SAOS-164]TGD73030.1 hypothetical protein E4634_12145 [Haliea sp. SAOS-164]
MRIESVDEEKRSSLVLWAPLFCLALSLGALSLPGGDSGLSLQEADYSPQALFGADGDPDGLDGPQVFPAAAPGWLFPARVSVPLPRATRQGEPRPAMAYPQRARGPPAVTPSVVS